MGTYLFIAYEVREHGQDNWAHLYDNHGDLDFDREVDLEKLKAQKALEAHPLYTVWKDYDLHPLFWKLQEFYQPEPLLDASETTRRRLGLDLGDWGSTALLHAVIDASHFYRQLRKRPSVQRYVDVQLECLRAAERRGPVRVLWRFD